MSFKLLEIILYWPVAFGITVLRVRTGGRWSSLFSLYHYDGVWTKDFLFYRAFHKLLLEVWPKLIGWQP